MNMRKLVEYEGMREDEEGRVEWEEDGRWYAGDENAGFVL